MSNIEILDVTQIEPQLKHPAIFRHFDDLQKGGSFILHNDHNPQPLYYQLLEERGNIFSWKYLEQGPQWWKVQITKLNTATETASVGAIAAGDPRKAEVFRKFGLDFCCGGTLSLEESCKNANVNIATVKNELERISLPASIAPDRDYNNWNLNFLADYIINIHHKYVTDAATPLKELSKKVSGRHGDAHPELFEIDKHTTALIDEMISHQVKEEKILFPFITKMVQCERENIPFTYPPFGTIESPVQMMLADHDEAAAHAKALHQLTGGYQLPEDACESYRYFYYRLNEFSEDLYQHIHLENNILFPKAIMLEKKLMN